MPWNCRGCTSSNSFGLLAPSDRSNSRTLPLDLFHRRHRHIEKVAAATRGSRNCSPPAMCGSGAVAENQTSTRFTLPRISSLLGVQSSSRSTAACTAVHRSRIGSTTSARPAVRYTARRVLGAEAVALDRIESADEEEPKIDGSTADQSNRPPRSTGHVVGVGAEALLFLQEMPVEPVERRRRTAPVFISLPERPSTLG